MYHTSITHIWLALIMKLHACAALIELPLTTGGYRYCITLTESKWAEAMPIPTKEATHVAEFLHRMILRHGCPQEIVSDQVIIIEYGSGIHRFFQLLTYNSKMRRATRLKSRYMRPILRELGNGRDVNSRV